jgi:hypothetical protein
MHKTEALAHFGTQEKLAQALRITRQAVSQWRELVPLGQAYRLEGITGGRLVVNLRLYERQKAAQIQKRMEQLEAQGR